jgi:c-di-GMP-binding flagellar brake protein YcgR
MSGLLHPTPDDERRQYFRIRNLLFMSYETIENIGEYHLAKDKDSDPSLCVHLLKELNKLEQQNRIFLNTLQKDQGVISSYITQLNNEFGLLTQYIVRNLDAAYRELQEVDLSGGGVRFESGSELNINQELKMEIILLPEYTNILTYGKVVDCQKSKDKQAFELAVTFSQIHESDRDQIIKHVLKAQSKQLRTDKENPPSES